MAKVLIFPGWEKCNYYSLLYKNIEDTTLASYSGAYFPLIRNVNRHSCDVIHLHWPADYLALTEHSIVKFFVRYFIALSDIITVRYLFRKPIVWTIHNLYEHNSVHLKLERIAKQLFVKLCNRLIVHGQSAVNLVKEEFGAQDDKISIIKHGTFRPLYKGTNLSKVDCRIKLNLPPDAKVYLFQGTEHDYKGLQQLIEVFSEWNEPDTVLFVAGKVSKKTESIIKQGKARILLHNKYIADDDMAVYFGAADWMVTPYKRILTSATLITGMGFGKPIIAPAIGTLPDYLDEHGGILYPGIKKESLHSALAKSVDANIDLMGQHNAKRDEELDWERISNQTISIYKSIVDER